MPLFFLMGGEIVIAIVGSRIAFWLFRGLRAWRAEQAAGPPDPPPERDVVRASAEVHTLAVADASAKTTDDALAA
jgi:hypothetical protein